MTDAFTQLLKGYNDLISFGDITTSRISEAWFSHEKESISSIRKELHHKKMITSYLLGFFELCECVDKTNIIQRARISLKKMRFSCGTSTEEDKSELINGMVHILVICESDQKVFEKNQLKEENLSIFRDIMRQFSTPIYRSFYVRTFLNQLRLLTRKISNFAETSVKEITRLQGYLDTYSHLYEKEAPVFDMKKYETIKMVKLRSIISKTIFDGLGLLEARKKLLEMSENADPEQVLGCKKAANTYKILNESFGGSYNHNHIFDYFVFHKFGNLLDFVEIQRPQQQRRQQQQQYYLSRNESGDFVYKTETSRKPVLHILNSFQFFHKELLDGFCVCLNPHFLGSIILVLHKGKMVDTIKKFNSREKHLFVSLGFGYLMILKLRDSSPKSFTEIEKIKRVKKKKYSVIDWKILYKNKVKLIGSLKTGQKTLWLRNNYSDVPKSDLEKDILGRFAVAYKGGFLHFFPTDVLYWKGKPFEPREDKDDNDGNVLYFKDNRKMSCYSGYGISLFTEKTDVDYIKPSYIPGLVDRVELDITSNSGKLKMVKMLIEAEQFETLLDFSKCLENVGREIHFYDAITHPNYSFNQFSHIYQNFIIFLHCLVVMKNDKNDCCPLSKLSIDVLQHKIIPFLSEFDIFMANKEVKKIKRVIELETCNWRDILLGDDMINKIPIPRKIRVEELKDFVFSFFHWFETFSRGLVMEIEWFTIGAIRVAVPFLLTVFRSVFDDDMDDSLFVKNQSLDHFVLQKTRIQVIRSFKNLVLLGPEEELADIFSSLVPNLEYIMKKRISCEYIDEIYPQIAIPIYTIISHFVKQKQQVTREIDSNRKNSIGYDQIIDLFCWYVQSFKTCEELRTLCEKLYIIESTSSFGKDFTNFQEIIYSDNLVMIKTKMKKTNHFSFISWYVKNKLNQQLKNMEKTTTTKKEAGFNTRERLKNIFLSLNMLYQTFEYQEIQSLVNTFFLYNKNMHEEEGKMLIKIILDSLRKDHPVPSFNTNAPFLSPSIFLDEIEEEEELLEEGNRLGGRGRRIKSQSIIRRIESTYHYLEFIQMIFPETNKNVPTSSSNNCMFSDELKMNYIVPVYSVFFRIFSDSNFTFQSHEDLYQAMRCFLNFLEHLKKLEETYHGEDVDERIFKKFGDLKFPKLLFQDVSHGESSTIELEEMYCKYRYINSILGLVDLENGSSYIRADRIVDFTFSISNSRVISVMLKVIRLLLFSPSSSKATEEEKIRKFDNPVIRKYMKRILEKVITFIQCVSKLHIFDTYDHVETLSRLVVEASEIFYDLKQKYGVLFSDLKLSSLSSTRLSQNSSTDVQNMVRNRSGLLTVFKYYAEIKKKEEEEECEGEETGDNSNKCWKKAVDEKIFLISRELLEVFDPVEEEGDDLSVQKRIDDIQEELEDILKIYVNQVKNFDYRMSLKSFFKAICFFDFLKGKSNLFLEDKNMYRFTSVLIRLLVSSTQDLFPRNNAISFLERNRNLLKFDEEEVKSFKRNVITMLNGDVVQFFKNVHNSTVPEHLRIDEEDTAGDSQISLLDAIDKNSIETLLISRVQFIGKHTDLLPCTFELMSFEENKKILCSIDLIEGLFEAYDRGRLWGGSKVFKKSINVMFDYFFPSDDEIIMKGERRKLIRMVVRSISTKWISSPVSGRGEMTKTLLNLLLPRLGKFKEDFRHAIDVETGNLLIQSFHSNIYFRHGSIISLDLDRVFELIYLCLVRENGSQEFVRECSIDSSFLGKLCKSFITHAPLNRSYVGVPIEVLQWIRRTKVCLLIFEFFIRNRSELFDHHVILKHELFPTINEKFSSKNVVPDGLNDKGRHKVFSVIEPESDVPNPESLYGYCNLPPFEEIFEMLFGSIILLLSQKDPVFLEEYAFLKCVETVELLTYNKSSSEDHSLVFVTGKIFSKLWSVGLDIEKVKRTIQSGNIIVEEPRNEVKEEDEQKKEKEEVERFESISFDPISRVNNVQNVLGDIFFDFRNGADISSTEDNRNEGSPMSDFSFSSSLPAVDVEIGSNNDENNQSSSEFLFPGSSTPETSFFGDDVVFNFEDQENVDSNLKNSTILGQNEGKEEDGEKSENEINTKKDEDEADSDIFFF